MSQEPTAAWANRRDRVPGLDPSRILFQHGQGGHLRPHVGGGNQKIWRSLCEDLEIKVKAVGAELLVWDVLANYLPVVDENNSAQMSDALTPLRDIADQGCTVLLLHHSNKTWNAKGSSKSRGSSHLAGEADVRLELRETADDTRTLTAAGRWEPPAPLEYRRTDGEMRLVDAPDDPDRRQCGLFRKHVLPLMPTRGGLTVKEILERWPEGYEKPTDKTLYRILDAAMAYPAVERQGRGGRWDQYRYCRLE